MIEFETATNFSEGRNPDIVEKIVAPFQQTRDVLFLDLHTDEDHNRSVVTAVGTGDGLRTALLEATRVALNSIQIFAHKGVHPFMGAVDVVPFIPLGDSTMADATDHAKRFAREVSDKFAVPVYLYAEATTRDHTKDLYRLRNFDFRELESRMEEEKWHPDFGPSKLHPTGGAMAVGSRDFLIAVNVDLEVDEVDVARDIASSIRESSGGLPGVQALGMELSRQDRIMVSMNLTDYEKTSLYALIDRVHREADDRGVTPGPTEIVGLLPEEALEGGDPADLRIPDFHPDRYVLERKIEAARQGEG